MSGTTPLVTTMYGLSKAPTHVLLYIRRPVFPVYEVEKLRCLRKIVFGGIFWIETSKSIIDIETLSSPLHIHDLRDHPGHISAKHAAFYVISRYAETCPRCPRLACYSARKFHLEIRTD